MLRDIEAKDRVSQECRQKSERIWALSTTKDFLFKKAEAASQSFANEGNTAQGLEDTPQPDLKDGKRSRRPLPSVLAMATTTISCAQKPEASNPF